MQDSVSVRYVAARKLCVIVDRKINNWSCTLSYKKCHLTLLCLPRHFVITLTIFEKLKYYFDFDKSAITLQPSRNEELCHFPILIEKYRVLQLLSVRNLKSLKVFSCFFSIPKIYSLLFYMMERCAPATYNISQANWVVFDWFFDICYKNCLFWSCSM